MLTLRRPRSLRARLTLIFTVVAGLTLGAAAVVIYQQMQRAVLGVLDAALLEEAEQLAALAPAADRPRMARQIARERDHGPAKFVLMLDGSGRVVAEGGRVPHTLREKPPPPMPVTRSLWVRGRRRGMRVVRHDSAEGVVVIGVDAARPLRTLAEMRIDVVLGTAFVLVVLALLAWAVTSRATGELGRLANEIEAVEASTLDRRLAGRDTLEVDALVVVLNRLLARLEAAIGHLRRFTADAAHELRTPVAALRATLEVALARDGGPERWRDGLLDGIEQAERLGRLSEALLALSAVEAGAVDATRVPLRIDRLTAEVASELEPIAIEQHRPFDCDPAGEAWVSGSPDLLRRVLVNLIDNAFRHTPPTSAVGVRVGGDGATVRVTIEDQGPGITAEDRPRLFERFGRGRGAAATGAGLGLALSREVAERHGGSLAIDSDPVRGTRAVLTLPRIPAVTEACAAPDGGAVTTAA